MLQEKKAQLQSQIGSMYFQKSKLEEQIKHAESQLAVYEEIENNNCLITAKEDKITAEGLDSEES
jgi:hypothetical protein